MRDRTQAIVAEVSVVSQATIPAKDLYALQVGDHFAGGEIAAEYVVCAPMRLLGRKLRSNDRVHCERRRGALVQILVRKVARQSGKVVLVSLDPQRGEPIPLTEASIEGIVVGAYTRYRL
jgi:hypothetical protein